MKVLFNADDFGLTEGVTDGIVQAHLKGIVQSTTLMMNGLAVDYAVEQAKQTPTLKTGIHLVLTWGKPLSNEVPDLLDENGNFKYRSTFEEMEPPEPAEVEREWRTQIEAFLDTGLPLHHIDSHHHVHGWKPLKDTVSRLAKEYNVPVRYVDSLKSNPELLLTENLYLGFYGEGINKNIFEELKELDANSVEIMTHPAIVDQKLKEVSSYNQERETELDILCKLTRPEWAE